MSYRFGIHYRRAPVFVRAALWSAAGACELGAALFGAMVGTGLAADWPVSILVSSAGFTALFLALALVCVYAALREYRVGGRRR